MKGGVYRMLTHHRTEQVLQPAGNGTEGKGETGHYQEAGKQGASL